MRFSPFAVAGLCALGGGCGVGGGVLTGLGETLSVVALSVATEDGVVLSDHSVRTDGVLPPTGDLGQPGSTPSGRQFFSFDLSAIPAGSVVQSAVLRLDLFVVVGNPFTSLGAVVVDHLDYGGGLDFGDYAARGLEEGLGPLASDATLGPKTLDVTASVVGDVARGRTRAQFRLRFAPKESDGDVSNDFASFAEAEAAVTGLGQRPTLSLVVRLPR